MRFYYARRYLSLLSFLQVRHVKRVIEELPLAPEPEQRNFNSKEMRKLEEIEEATLRELRIFLREICAKLARNRT